MSLTQLRDSGGSLPVRPVTAQTLLEMKHAGLAITALTAYDYPTARLVDQAGIDLILVGDSVGMTVLGYESTLPVTMEEMLHHTRAVARGVKRAFLVADMPFGSYHASADEAIRNATRFIKESGAHAVKIEGGERRAGLVRRMTDAEISVVAHIGLTPQSIHRMSGYKVQGRSVEAIEVFMPTRPLCRMRCGGDRSGRNSTGSCCRSYEPMYHPYHRHRGWARL
jgi:3-methyl-2-oxobutanoate hydroxymethyltransferase